MILPIYAYGSPVLKKKASDITKEYPDIQQLIKNMFETMDKADGVGLAAPQIGLSIRLFVIDDSHYLSELYRNPNDPLKFRKVFINAQILKEEGELWKFDEGCLSIPNSRGNVERRSTITIKYLDENFVEHEDTFKGMRARIIQHEYDHIEGILFTDKINPLRKTLLKSKLNNISNGIVSVNYKMKFNKK